MTSSHRTFIWEGVRRKAPIFGWRRSKSRVRYPRAMQDRNLRQAEEWIKGKEEGLSEEELLAQTLGKADLEDLSEVESEYAEKIKSSMETKIKMIKERDAQVNEIIEKGKSAFSNGKYGNAARLFESALEITTKDTLAGGQAQIWLALAYDSNGKLEEAKGIYQELQSNHPLPSIRTQAANLLYILEAPKLKIREDERVKIPDLAEIDENAFRNRRKTSRTSKPRKLPKAQASRTPSWEEKFLENSPVIRTFRNRYVQIAFVVVSIGVSVFSAYLKQK